MSSVVWICCESHDRWRARMAGRTVMSLLRSESMPIRVDADVVLVRQQVRAWAATQGFGLVDQTKIVTAASELARNTLVHGGGGHAVLEVVSDGIRRGLRLVFEDKGPG